MKIISGFKDYYDFVQGQYGIDPYITYERHFQEINSVHQTVKNKWEKISINEQPKLKHLQSFGFAIIVFRPKKSRSALRGTTFFIVQRNVIPL